MTRIRSIMSTFRDASRFGAPLHYTLNLRRTIVSESNTQPRQFLIHVPDCPGQRAARLNTRQAHIEQCMHLIDNGKLSHFGVTMTHHSVGGEVSDINGSVMVLEAKSEDAVKDFLKRDAYTRAGVWDVEKATIWPFKAG